jgi:hypothetical protein
MLRAPRLAHAADWRADAALGRECGRAGADRRTCGALEPLGWAIRRDLEIGERRGAGDADLVRARRPWCRNPGIGGQPLAGPWLVSGVGCDSCVRTCCGRAGVHIRLQHVVPVPRPHIRSCKPDQPRSPPKSRLRVRNLRTLNGSAGHGRAIYQARPESMCSMTLSGLTRSCQWDRLTPAYR